jgi:hypothetical protein
MMHGSVNVVVLYQKQAQSETILLVTTAEVRKTPSRMRIVHPFSKLIKI